MLCDSSIVHASWTGHFLLLSCLTDLAHSERTGVKEIKRGSVHHEGSGIIEMIEIPNRFLPSFPVSVCRCVGVSLHLSNNSSYLPVEDR